MTKYTCEFVTCSAQLFQITLKVALELGVKADDTVEVRTLELDVTLGSGKVSISVMNV